MPAEWETHKATWLVWPHNPEDWPGKFEPIPWVWAEIVRILHHREIVHILCHDEAVLAETRKMCKFHHVDLRKCHFHIQANDRCWVRDSGPTAIVTPKGGVEWLCWHFNAWAKYKNHRQDQYVARAIATLSGRAFEEVTRPGGSTSLVLEGGGLETNGQGILMVTEEWLLSKTQVRNPGMTRKEYEFAFRKYLGINQVIWLSKGCAKDDTHGHVDDIARFTDERTIVLAYEKNTDDENYESSRDNWKRLLCAYKRFNLDTVKLPYPRPIFFNGQRVPASYANFYIANGVVIVPTFNDPNDRAALNLLQKLFPKRQVIGIHSLDLVWGYGTLHCLTQQEPA